MIFFKTKKLAGLVETQLCLKQDQNIKFIKKHAVRTYNQKKDANPNHVMHNKE